MSALNKIYPAIANGAMRVKYGPQEFWSLSYDCIVVVTSILLAFLLFPCMKYVVFQRAPMPLAVGKKNLLENDECIRILDDFFMSNCSTLPVKMVNCSTNK